MNRIGGLSADAICLYFMLLLITLAPWPLGLRLPWASMLAAATVIAVGALLCGIWLLREKVLPWNPLFAPILAFLGWTGSQWLFGWTIDSHATAYEWVRYLSYGVVFGLTVVLSGHDRVRRTLARQIVFVGLAVGAFAIVQYLTWNEYLYWVYDPPYGGFRFGPFNNRNYFAGFMITVLPLALTSIVAPRPLERRPATVFFAWLACLAVLASLSRAGILAAAVGAVVGVYLAGSRSRWFSLRTGESRRWRLREAVLMSTALATLLVALLVLQPHERIVERLESGIEGRVTMWRDALPMVSDRPVAGFGLNTFVWGFPRYDRQPDSAFQTNVHNEYLEMLIETGVIGAAICAWFLVLLFRYSSAQLGHSRDGNRELVAGGIGAWAGILVFGLTDFPTIIPAINYNLAVLAALLTTPPTAPSTPKP